MWKDFFYFSKREKQGIIVLLIILLLCVGTSIYLSHRQVAEEAQSSEPFKAEYNRFIASLSEAKTTHKSSTTSSSAKNDTRQKNQSASTKNKAAVKLPKYPKGIVVCMNSADTTELMRIPGIGRARANMIVNYRKELGGFVSTSQLLEIKRLTSAADSLVNWFCLKDSTIIPLNINTASPEKLESHPYINSSQAKAIIAHRESKGKVTDVEELRAYKVFKEKDIERLLPYISF